MVFDKNCKHINQNLKFYMRVPQNQLLFLKTQIHEYLPDAKIYLFGSRVDDSKRGGDIDILILSENKLDLKQRIAIKLAFAEKFGEQKIDLVSFLLNENSAFKELVLLTAIKIG